MVDNIGSFLSLVEKVLQLVEFLRAEVGDEHVDLDIEVALLVGVVDRHAFLFDHLHEARLGDAGLLDDDLPAVEVLDGAREAEDGLSLAGVTYWRVMVISVRMWSPYLLK